MSAVRWARALSVGYVEIFRNIPLLVQMWWAYFGLQQIVNTTLNEPFGLRILIPSTFACILALSLYTGAYMGEVVRSGIRSIPRGQWEAARSTGLSFVQALRDVVLPQAVRLTIPPLTNRTIAITKGTALGTVVAVTEILGEASSAMSNSYNPSPLMMGGAKLWLSSLNRSRMAPPRPSTTWQLRQPFQKTSRSPL